MLPLSLNELEDSLIFSVFIRIPTRGFDFIDNMKSTILVAVIVCASIAGVYSDFATQSVLPYQQLSDRQASYFSVIWDVVFREQII
uniref:Uncharacterized protein n=1 Tax=Trichobilharzia regenti TaxID=157069 RepID=A0AA85J8X1_TRIRE|nr:unnamed protein product [Trichobilharzia regenti]